MTSQAIQEEELSGFNITVGYELTEWSDGHAVLELDLEPRHLNRTGVLHGGVIATMLDAVCGYAGQYCSEPGNIRYAVTLSLTTNFLGQAKAGRVRCVARRTGGGRKIYFCAGEMFNANGDLIATGEGVYRLRTGSEDLKGVPRNAPI
ncbi:MAG: PaaI family thioesterase [Rhodospirillales bacterium]